MYFSFSESSCFSHCQHGSHAVTQIISPIHGKGKRSAPARPLPWAVTYFHHTAELLSHFVQRHRIGAPMPHIRCQHAVVPFTVRFSAEAYMMRFYTGTLKQHRSVVVIYRSRNQSVAHTHSPMLPCQILTIIEILVTTAYLEFGKRAGYPVIQNRSRLILRTEAFPQHPIHPPVPGAMSLPVPTVRLSTYHTP